MWLVWLGCAWLTGIALGLGRDLDDWWPVAPGLLLLLAGVALLWPRWQRSALLTALLLGVVLLGAWRAVQVRPVAADLPPGAIEAVRGRVVDWPTRGAVTDAAALAVEAVRINGEWRGGAARFRADVPSTALVGQGDRLELFGSYRALDALPAGGFRASLEHAGLHGQFRAYTLRLLETGPRDDPTAWRVRSLTDLEERLRTLVPGDAGALATALLFGDQHFLPKSTRDAFAATSTSHTMALSGWNIALIAGLCAMLGRRLRVSRARLWLIGSGVVIWCFVLFVGATPTLIRAALMGSLYLLAEATGRRGDALTTLFVAMIGITLLAPMTLFNIGFQLSCAATIGLVTTSARCVALLQRWRLPAWLAAIVAPTIVAELFTLPLLLHYFGRLSVVTLPANLIVEPLVPAIMAGAGITVVGSFLPGPLAALAGWFTGLPASLMLRTVESFGALPWVTVWIATPPWPAVFALYALLALALAPVDWLKIAWERAREQMLVRRDALAPTFGGVVSGFVLVLWIALMTG